MIVFYVLLKKMELFQIRCKSKEEMLRDYFLLYDEFYLENFVF